MLTSLTCPFCDGRIEIINDEQPFVCKKCGAQFDYPDKAKKERERLIQERLDEEYENLTEQGLDYFEIKNAFEEKKDEIIRETIKEIPEPIYALAPDWKTWFMIVAVKTGREMTIKEITSSDIADDISGVAWCDGRDVGLILKKKKITPELIRKLFDLEAETPEEDAFIIKTQGIIWMDRRMSGDQRRNFVATYVIDNGYPSMADCENAVRALDYDSDDFAFVKLNNMYYAVNMHNYQTHVVITKNRIIYTTRAFQECPDYIILSEMEGDEDLPYANRFDSDSKKWQDGICSDLLMFDPDVEVYFRGKRCRSDSIIYNNVLITFGLNFFITQICINTSDYVSHVLAYYYSNRSLAYMERDIRNLKQLGFSYYNPYTGECSKTYKEKNKAEKLKTEGLTVPEVIRRPKLEDGSKIMRQREMYPPRVDI